MDLGRGYVLLRPRDRWMVKVDGIGGNKLDDVIGRNAIRRWGRLKLPNGQIARSVFKEKKNLRSNLRVSRNVKV